MQNCCGYTASETGYKQLNKWKFNVFLLCLREFMNVWNKNVGIYNRSNQYNVNKPTAGQAGVARRKRTEKKIENYLFNSNVNSHSGNSYLMLCVRWFILCLSASMHIHAFIFYVITALIVVYLSIFEMEMIFPCNGQSFIFITLPLRPLITFCMKIFYFKCHDRHKNLKIVYQCGFSVVRNIRIRIHIKFIFSFVFRLTKRDLVMHAILIECSLINFFAIFWPCFV